MVHLRMVDKHSLYRLKVCQEWGFTKEFKGSGHQCALRG
jgi:hypothetical protein